MSKARVYLAGAIRDGNNYDFTWREQATFALRDVAEVLNPLAGKELGSDGIWRAHGMIMSDANYLVPRDLNMIRSADMILANLLPISETYPSLGTMMELGIALERGILVVAAGKPGVIDHPFVQRVAYARFGSIDEAITFALRDVQVIARR